MVPQQFCCSHVVLIYHGAICGGLCLNFHMLMLHAKHAAARNPLQVCVHTFAGHHSWPSTLAHTTLPGLKEPDEKAEPSPSSPFSSPSSSPCLRSTGSASCFVGQLGGHVQSVSSRMISTQYHGLVAAHTFQGCNGTGAVGTNTARPAS